MSLLGVPRYLWTKSPRDYWRRLTRAGQGPDGAVWTTGKHRQWNRLPYYLHAFEVIAQRNGQSLQFAGRKVLELGAGPVLGFAPLALVEGAATVAIVDPGYEDQRGNRHFQDEYLFPLFCTHSRLTSSSAAADRRDATLQDFESFLTRVAQIDVHARPVEQFQTAAPVYDIVLSKSCIEYLTDLDRALAVCHGASTSGSLHCHYLDFSLHRAAHRVGSPFGTMYQHSRQSNPEYFKHPGGDLNLLRPSEIVAAFERKFQKVYFMPLDDYRRRMSLDDLHPDWAKYRPEDLTIANGLLLAVK